MQITCPCCSARFSLEAALSDDAAREAIATALKLPGPLADLVLRYLALFRPPKRALSWKRVARLLNELLAPIQNGQIERHRRAWSAPHVLWSEALQEVIDRRDKLTLPLEGHGYLFEIIARKANGVENAAEEKQEQSRQYAYNEPRSTENLESDATVRIADVLSDVAGQDGSGTIRKALDEATRKKGRDGAAQLKDALK